MAQSLLRRWFGGLRKDPVSVEEARAELDGLAADRPAFRAPVLWLRALLPDLVPEVDASQGPALTKEQAHAKLGAGVPLLRGEKIHFDVKAFQQRWSRACDALETLQPDGAAAALAKSLHSGKLDPESLVNAIAEGKARYVHERAAELGLQAELAATLTRYVLFPVFTAMGNALAPLHENSGWSRGYCPTCGSRPLLGEFRGLDQSRYLRCGLCSASWESARQRCPLCENTNHEQLHFLHREGEESRCRAAVCDACRGYVKMLSTLAQLPPLSLLVADAATLYLDLAAAERGYGL
jgi:FdhE protein